MLTEIEQMRITTSLIKNISEKNIVCFSRREEITGTEK